MQIASALSSRQTSAFNLRNNRLLELGGGLQFIGGRSVFICAYIIILIVDELVEVVIDIVV